MFWNAFVWGIGVSCGACFGLLLFIILKALLDRVTKTDAYKKAEEYKKTVLKLMEERNGYSEELVESMQAIVEHKRIENAMVEKVVAKTTSTRKDI